MSPSSAIATTATAGGKGEISRVRQMPIALLCSTGLQTAPPQSACATKPYYTHVNFETNYFQSGGDFRGVQTELEAWERKLLQWQEY